MAEPQQGLKDKKHDEDPAKLSELDLLVIIMQHGSKMLKIDRKSRVAMKTFTLDNDMLGFRYLPTTKNDRVEVKLIKKVSLTPMDSNHNIGQFKVSPENCFTIEIENREPMIAIPLEKRIAQCWVRGLSLLAANKASTDKTLSPKRKWLFEKFDYYDRDKSGLLEFGELIKIVACFNMPMTKDNLMKKFQEFNTNEEQVGQSAGLDRNEFAEFFDSLSKRTDIEQTIMAQYSSNGNYLTCEELLSFLRNSQGVTEATDEDCKRIVQSCELISELKSKNCLGVDGFSGYLLSKEGNLFNELHDAFYQDLTQPLSHYFISSSHNTYLEGDQLRGQASVQAYINALKNGCRCVELDCWDGDDGDPVIYHGHTLVNKILFKDVIQAVQEFAFTASPYPVILSLENHCSLSQQTKMAAYLKDILGDKLFCGCVDGSLQNLPSPESFKHKILVKGKKLKETVDNGGDEYGVISEEEEDDEVYLDEQGNEVQSQQSKKLEETVGNGREENNVISEEKVDDEVYLDEQGNEVQPQQNHDKKSNGKKKGMKLAPELSSLVNYCKAVHFYDFDKSKREGQFYEMSSFGENKTKKFIKEKCSEFIEYNKRQLSRIYPAGSRVHSSNYNPLMAWSAGCQIVALNFQTESAMMDLYLGKFRQNGNSGYILKPEYMRSEVPELTKSQTLVVKVISGQQLPKVSGGEKGEIVDPYATVAVHDVPEEKQILQTKVVNNNGFNPCWNETFEFKVNNPEMALVRFTVYDHDVGKDDFIGQFSLPFTSMKQGYRQITLNGRGTKSLFPASLFVHVKID